MVFDRHTRAAERLGIRDTVVVQDVAFGGNDDCWRHSDMARRPPSIVRWRRDLAKTSGW